MTQETHETAGVLIGGERWITLTQVCDLTGLSMSTIKRRINDDPTFPVPTDQKRWARSEVVEWYTRRS